MDGMAFTGSTIHRCFSSSQSPFWSRFSLFPTNLHLSRAIGQHWLKQHGIAVCRNASQNGGTGCSNFNERIKVMSIKVSNKEVSDGVDSQFNHPHRRRYQTHIYTLGINYLSNTSKTRTLLIGYNIDYKQSIYMYICVWATTATCTVLLSFNRCYYVGSRHVKH